MFNNTSKNFLQNSKKISKRKFSFRGIASFTEESIPKLGTDLRKKLVLQNSQNNKKKWFVQPQK